MSHCSGYPIVRVCSSLGSF